MLLGLLAQGCAGAAAPPATAPPAAPAAVAMPLQSLLAAADRVTATGLRATGTIALERPSGALVLPLRLLLSRSGALRLEAGGPAGFLMVSDGLLVRVQRRDGPLAERSAWAPAGAGTAADERLAPADLLDALLPGPYTARDASRPGVTAVATAEGPELRWPRPEGEGAGVERVLRLDPETLRPARLQRLGPDGTAEAVITYLAWGETPGEPPRRVRVCPGSPGGCYVLELEEWLLDPPTRPEDWRLGAPRASIGAWLTASRGAGILGAQQARRRDG